MLKDTQTEFSTERSAQRSFGFWYLIFLFLYSLASGIRLLVLHLEMSYFKNEHFAFSLPVPTTVIYMLYAIVFALIIFFLKRNWNQLSEMMKCGFVLILSVGFSNVLERLGSGYVVDYVYIANGVFNIADVYIILGALMILADKNIFKKL